MVVHFRQLCSKYLGLNDKISVVNDFYKYNILFPDHATTGFWLEQISTGKSSLPGKLHLLDQIRLLLGEQIIHLHFRIVTSYWLWRAGLNKIDPITGNPFNIPTIDEEVYYMRSVYARYGIAIVISSTQYFNIPPNRMFVDLDPDPEEVTDDENYLFDNYRGDVPIEFDENGIPIGAHAVIFFVYSTNPPKNGTTIRPLNGSIVTVVASEWTLGHEMGHLCGLNHVDKDDCMPGVDSCCLSCLMTGAGTSLINVSLPTLNNSEVQIIKDSAYTIS